MRDEFVNIPILDNFYQTSSFFPMPVVLISTIAENGGTNLGAYSLCFPYIVGGTHAMLLISRHDSNTSHNIQRTGVCAINFIPDDKKYTRNCVMLGYPGETTDEKMVNSIFTLQPSARTEEERHDDTRYPDIVHEALQVFECTWNPDYPLKVSPDSKSCHFVLHIDKIIVKARWQTSLIEGRGFPRLPINYGFRHNAYFWFTKGQKPYKEDIPKEKAVDISAIKYAAERIDSDIRWHPDAYARLVKVPRVFLTRVVTSCIEAAKEQGIEEITPEFLDQVRQKQKK